MTNPEDTYGASNYKPLDVVISKGRGVWVWDVDGKRYLDCVSAYSAVNHGHCHPRIHKTLVEQAERISLISRAFRTDRIGPFSEQICALSESKKALFMNSGVEAVETALKAVRKWGYGARQVPENEAEIIVCSDNFHGRTIAVVGFSTVEKYKKGFGPFPGGFTVVPFGDASALEEAITDRTVGFLVEPIQGEGGINVPPDGYLAEARRICTEHGIAMICDEIQTGLGRTGTLFAEDHENVKADVLVIGKSLGGGYCPVSAVLARGDILNVFAPGEHGSTFGGNPLACAVGQTALDVLVEEKLAENADRMGAFLRNEISQLKSDRIRRIKGKGLMIGIELASDEESAADLSKKLLKRGLLCNAATSNVLRFTPPLVLCEEDAHWALERLKDEFSS